jgi:hypothetical protein
MRLSKPTQVVVADQFLRPLLLVGEIALLTA